MAVTWRRILACVAVALCAMPMMALSPLAAHAPSSHSTPAPMQVPARVSAWREDLDSILTVFTERDRSFTPATRAAFVSSISRLRREVGRLDDPHIIVRLARAVAAVGNPHTRLYLLRNRTALRRYPIRVWWFGQTLRVVRVRPGEERLLGARLVTIGGRRALDVAALVAPLYAGTPSWKRYMSTYTMTSPEILMGLDVIGGNGAATLVVERRDGTRERIVVAPDSLVATSEPTEAWWDLSPLHPSRQGPWATLLAADSTRLPLYLRHPDRNYWMEYRPADSLLYVSFPRSQDDPLETTATFGARVLESIATQQPRVMVVDLRFNTGGNLDLSEAFLHALARTPIAQDSRRFFVLTGRATFSAGIYAAALLATESRATLVGEPMGDGLDFWAEGGNLVLPRSGLTLHYADRFHSYSPKEYPRRRPYVRDLSVRRPLPDDQVEGSFDAYVTGRDELLERALALSRRPVSGEKPLVRRPSAIRPQSAHLP